MMDEQTTGQSATHPRYVVATLPTGVYVVYDRWDARVADGAYLSLVDAQWAADQRNQRQWRMTVTSEASRERQDDGQAH